MRCAHLANSAQAVHGCRTWWLVRSSKVGHAPPCQYAVCPVLQSRTASAYQRRALPSKWQLVASRGSAGLASCRPSTRKLHCSAAVTEGKADHSLLGWRDGWLCACHSSTHHAAGPQRRSLAKTFDAASSEECLYTWWACSSLGRCTQVSVDHFQLQCMTQVGRQWHVQAARQC